mmetsp:Transcript_34766/g.100118  ORF Transcript_34766/g.100118 Transcript_34766/m.100118 type:complete len:271 (+) Transcript_34766:897-1709(+)
MVGLSFAVPHGFAELVLRQVQTHVDGMLPNHTVEVPTAGEVDEGEGKLRSVPHLDVYSSLGPRSVRPAHTQKRDRRMAGVLGVWDAALDGFPLVRLRHAQRVDDEPLARQTVEDSLHLSAHLPVVRSCDEYVDVAQVRLAPSVAAAQLEMQLSRQELGRLFTHPLVDALHLCPRHLEGKVVDVLETPPLSVGVQRLWVFLDVVEGAEAAGPQPAGHGGADPPDLAERPQRLQALVFFEVVEALELACVEQLLHLLAHSGADSLLAGDVVS